MNDVNKKNVLSDVSGDKIIRFFICIPLHFYWIGLRTTEKSLLMIHSFFLFSLLQLNAMERNANAWLHANFDEKFIQYTHTYTKVHVRMVDRNWVFS